MLSVGVDLSARKPATAGMALAWSDGRGADRGEPPVLGLDDDAVLALVATADRSALDAPFGWPDAFRAHIDAWSERSAWTPIARRQLRFRLTDEFCGEHGRLPLSVSSDRIASTAMRCAELLARSCAGGRLDRVGGPVIEAYPAGALVAWDINVKGYKDTGASARRQDIASELKRRSRLDLCTATIERCAATDHGLDALVCALVARAVHRELTIAPPSGTDEQVGREGWIHLPRAGSLELLAD